MFLVKLKKIAILFIIGSVLLFVGSNITLAQQMQNYFFSFSLDLQGKINEIIKKFFYKDDADIYKKKYFDLLKELAAIKISLKNKDIINDLSRLEDLNKQVREVKVLKKDNFGYFYIQGDNLTPGDIILDKNFILVGKVKKVFSSYALVESLLVPNQTFNVSDKNGTIIGLAKTISNGFIEVALFKDVKLNINDLIFTDKDYFLSNLVIGSVVDLDLNQLNPRLIAKIAFDDEASHFLVFEK
ncbi:MAG: hypothetical protein KatS3mg097_195 [Candidatus Parcubacteria bacterium]|nr:MAG: hypothetical protein KatS3mg097_195 [Candidatus Parcubacteria bacterium]